METLSGNLEFQKKYIDTNLSKPEERRWLQRSVTEGYYSGRFFRERPYENKKMNIVNFLFRNHR